MDRWCRRTWVSKVAGGIKQQESILLDHLGSIHRPALDFRRMFSAGGRRVGDRRSSDAAADAAEREAEAGPEGVEPLQTVPEDAQSMLSQHSLRSHVSGLAEQLSGVSLGAFKTDEGGRAMSPAARVSQETEAMSPLALSPKRLPRSGQASVPALALSPSRKEMSGLQITHENVELGRPSSADALKEVHAEIMDKGVQLPTAGSGRRASISRHSSDQAGRKSLPDTPSGGLAAGAANQAPLTLAQLWARITRPPLPAWAAPARGEARGSAAASPLARRPRTPLQPWSSLPAAQQERPESRPSLQLPPPAAAVAPGLLITPSSPQWVPSPFSGSMLPEGMSHALAHSFQRSTPDDNSASPKTSRASRKPPILRHSSAVAPGWAQSSAGHSARASMDAGISRHGSSRTGMLQRAAQTLGRRSACQEDIQSILQVWLRCLVSDLLHSIAPFF